MDTADTYLERSGPLPPNYLSFSGADDDVDIGSLINLNKKYPIEWGILLSRKKQGKERYPSLGWICELASAASKYNQDIIGGNNFDAMRMNLTGHFCGEYIDMMEEDGYTGLEYLCSNFGITKFQFNLAGRKLSQKLKKNIDDWNSFYGCSSIIQVEDFPSDDDYQYLLDVSRGEGKEITKFPDPRIYIKKPTPEFSGWEGRYNIPGFAGGINQENILSICKKLEKYGIYYYLDMESSLRDNSNRFRLDFAEKIASQLWGPRNEHFYEDIPQEPETELLEEDEPTSLDTGDDYEYDD